MTERSTAFSGIDTGTPVLVLSAQNYGCLGIIRSLGRLGITVHAVDANPPAATSRSRYLGQRFVFDMEAATKGATVDYLLEVGKRIGRPSVLIPTWDETSLLVSDNQDVLAEHFLFPRQPPGLAASLANKKQMHFLAREHLVPTPNVSFPAGVEDVVAFAGSAAFPVMLKGIDGQRLKIRTGRKMVIVENPDELLSLYREMEDPADPNLMLQEYIPGGEHDVWMFNGYFDGGSDCLAGFTGRKLRQTPVYTGVTSLGVCLANDEVLRTTTRWMRELGYRGILDIGYRFDARDGLYKVLDANPRIGATFRLFTASNGLDVARALYLDITGQPVPEGRQVEGRKWMVEGGDLDSALQYRRDGKLTIRAWVASLRGVQEGSYFARDDLAPFMDASLGFLRRKSRGANGPGAGPDPPLQASVDQHFAVRADIYDRPTVDGLSYAKRRATTIQWIEELGLPRTARILDIGTGAGLTSVDFAERGFEVIATDTVSAMTEATSRLASERGVADRVRTLLADAHKLPFEDGAFDVAIAMGVLPWLHSPKQAMTEMARVLSPGGYALISVDNLFRMPDLLDPRRNPIGVTVVRWLGDALRRTGLRRSPRSNGLSRRDAPGTVETYLAGLGLTEIRRTTIGFGPITFWNHPIVPEGASVRLHRALQGLADRRVPVIRDLGGHWVILARKHSD